VSLSKALMRLRNHLYKIHMTSSTSRSYIDKITMKLVLPAYYSIMRIFFGSFVNHKAKIHREVRFQHDMLGVFVAGEASIGRGTKVFQHVTIGAHKKKGHRYLAPQIGEDVLIGANATLIGSCVVGDRSKIGAGVVLVDAIVPADSVIVNASAYNLTLNKAVYNNIVT
jgi:serine O-acetyltransferase